MTPVSPNISLAEYYFSFFKYLNSESKLDLIAQLSESLKKNDIKEETSLQSLFGAYKSEETAEEIIASIRTSRTFNRILNRFEKISASFT